MRIKNTIFTEYRRINGHRVVYIHFSSSSSSSSSEQRRRRKTISNIFIKRRAAPAKLTPMMKAKFNPPDVVSAQVKVEHADYLVYFE